MVRTGQADIIDLVPESAPEVDAAGAKLTVVEGVGMFIYQFWGPLLRRGPSLAHR